MSYKHINLEERYYIEVSLKKGRSHEKIGKSLGRSGSTITREVNRNLGKKGYRHQQAHQLAQKRLKEKPKAVKLTEEVKAHIRTCIQKNWSPEQTVGWLNKKDIIKLHHETVYQYILLDKEMGGELYTHLRHQNKTYRKRYGAGHNRTGIPNRIDIDERPEVANTRARIGDWEGDTIIGKNHKGAIVTLDERKSKLRLAFPVKNKTAQAVADAIVTVLSPLNHLVKTITFDNGKEFAYHEKIAEAVDCDIYFAKPYHSWERGQNENANGLLRQYFPKSMELIDVTVKEVFKAIHDLNQRPRKCLDFSTPYEAFKSLTGFDVEKMVAMHL